MGDSEVPLGCMGLNREPTDLGMNLDPKTINMGGEHWEWGDYKLNTDKQDSKTLPTPVREVSLAKTGALLPLSVRKLKSYRRKRNILLDT